MIHRFDQSRVVLQQIYSDEQPFRDALHAHIETCCEDDSSGLTAIERDMAVELCCSDGFYGRVFRYLVYRRFSFSVQIGTHEQQSLLEIFLEWLSNGGWEIILEIVLTIIGLLQRTSLLLAPVLVAVIGSFVASPASAQQVVCSGNVCRVVPTQTADEGLPRPIRRVVCRDGVCRVTTRPCIDCGCLTAGGCGIGNCQCHPRMSNIAYRPVIRTSPPRRFWLGWRRMRR